jgi:hypothetical protein
MRVFSFPALPQRWLALLLIISQLILSVLIVFVASQPVLLATLGLLAGVGIVVIFLRWPALGLAAAPAAGVLVPFLGPSGLSLPMIVVALLLGLWLLDMMTRQRQITLASSRTLWPLLGFLLIAFLSFGVGQLPWFTFARHAPLGAQLGGLAIIVLSAATFLLAANQIPDLKWLRAITWIFLAVATVSTILRLVLGGLGISTFSFLPVTGSVFYIWSVALAFSQAAFNHELGKGWRLALGALVVVTVTFLFFTKFADKSGWLACLATLAAIIVFHSRRSILALIPAGAAAALYLWAEVSTSEGYSISTRLDALVIMVRMVEISPIWGLGFANYYWYAPLYAIRGYAVSFSSHNNYMDILAQTGVVGLACFVLFVWQIGRLAWVLRKEAPAGFARAYTYGALGGLVGMGVAGMLGDWILPFFYNIGLHGFRSSMIGWLFLGGLVCIERMVNHRATPTVGRLGVKGV